MTTDDSDPFKGRVHGNLVFPDFHDRLFFIGRLSASQQKEWLRDHPDRWQTREDALRDLQARAGTDVTAPLTITHPEATAAAGDEIIIGERRLISERSLAAMLDYSPRQLQRWRTEQKGKGPPSTQIGRRFFYEITKVQEWIDRDKSR